MLTYCLKFTKEKLSSSLSFRQDVLRMIVELSSEKREPNYFLVCECLIFLEDSQRLIDLLVLLLRRKLSGEHLIAYQVGFDLIDRAPQFFINDVRVGLERDESVGEGEKQVIMEILKGEITISLHLDFLFRRNHSDLGVLNRIKGSFDRSSILHSATISANAFMHCGTTIDAFLRRNLSWLGKATNWAKYSATASLGVIHKGHIKNSLQILGPYLPKSINPSSASSSVYSEGGSLLGLGLIHSNRRNEPLLAQISELLRRPGTDKVVLHGACLCAGLVGMASEDFPLVELLLKILRLDDAVSGEAAAIAIGMVLFGCYKEVEGGKGGFGSMKDEDEEEDEEEEGEEDEEGGGGEQNRKRIGSVIQRLLRVSKDTEHERIIRGVAMGIALMFYGKEEKSDVLVQTLLNDEDSILRYGAMYVLGLSYCGTGKTRAIEKLLEVGVSDVSDDVRRAAIINLGFVLCSQPEELPRYVSLLSESFNPHVRYGVALALGIGCAGRPTREALRMLKRLGEDRKDYVRQAAFLGSSMLLIQTNDNEDESLVLDKSEEEGEGEEEEEEKEKEKDDGKNGGKGEGEGEGEKESEKMKEKGYVKYFRERYEDVWSARRGETLSKIGAILGSGVVDGGGRNVTIRIQKNGVNQMKNVLGMCMFSQYWFFFPYMHFLSLAMDPTAVICLNEDMNMPEFRFKSNASSDLFGYPKKEKSEGKKSKKKKASVHLSVLSRRRKRKKRMGQAGGDSTGGEEYLNTPFTPLSPTSPSKKKEGEGEENKEVSTSEVSADEKVSQEEKDKEEGVTPYVILTNPARVTERQSLFITYDVDVNFIPIKKGGGQTGILVLKPQKEDLKDVTFIQFKEKSKVLKEPEPPKPFEYVRN